MTSKILASRRPWRSTRLGKGTRCGSFFPAEFSLRTCCHLEVLNDPTRSQGTLVKQWTPASPSPPSAAPQYVVAGDCKAGDADQTGWSFADGAVKHNRYATTAPHRWRLPIIGSPALSCVRSDCLDATDPKQLELKPCDSTSAKQKFAFTKATGVLTLASDTTQCVDINMWTGPKVWLYRCHAGAPNEDFTFGASGTLTSKADSHAPKGKCLGASKQKPGGAAAGGGVETLQMWAKPMPSKAMAVLLINTVDAVPQDVDISLSDLNITASSASVRDIWAQVRAFDVTDLDAHSSLELQIGCKRKNVTEAFARVAG